MLLAAIALLLISIILIPISYIPARVEIHVDKEIPMNTDTTDLVEKILGLEGSLKVILGMELYANLSCEAGVRVMVYYMREAKEIYLEPLRLTKLPVNDTVAIISIPKKPGCSVKLEGGIEYLAYRYIWLLALSFILGLSGGIMLLRILISRISYFVL